MSFLFKRSCMRARKKKSKKVNPPDYVKELKEQFQPLASASSAHSNTSKLNKQRIDGPVNTNKKKNETEICVKSSPLASSSCSSLPLSPYTSLTFNKLDNSSQEQIHVIQSSSDRLSQDDEIDLNLPIQSNVYTVEKLNSDDFKSPVQSVTEFVQLETDFGLLKRLSSESMRNESKELSPSVNEKPHEKFNNDISLKEQIPECETTAANENELNISKPSSMGKVHPFDESISENIILELNKLTENDDNMFTNRDIDSCKTQLKGRNPLEDETNHLNMESMVYFVEEIGDTENNIKYFLPDFSQNVINGINESKYAQDSVEKASLKYQPSRTKRLELNQYFVIKKTSAPEISQNTSLDIREANMTPHSDNGDSISSLVSNKRNALARNSLEHCSIKSTVLAKNKVSEECLALVREIVEKLEKEEIQVKDRTYKSQPTHKYKVDEIEVKEHKCESQPTHSYDVGETQVIDRKCENQLTHKYDIEEIQRESFSRRNEIEREYITGNDKNIECDQNRYVSLEKKFFQAEKISVSECVSEAHNFWKELKCKDIFQKAEIVPPSCIAQIFKDSKIYYKHHIYTPAIEITFFSQPNKLKTKNFSNLDSRVLIESLSSNSANFNLPKKENEFNITKDASPKVNNEENCVIESDNIDENNVQENYYTNSFKSDSKSIRLEKDKIMLVSEPVQCSGDNIESKHLGDHLILKTELKGICSKIINDKLVEIKSCKDKDITSVIDTVYECSGDHITISPLNLERKANCRLSEHLASISDQNCNVHNVNKEKIFSYTEQTNKKISPNRYRTSRNALFNSLILNAMVNAEVSPSEKPITSSTLPISIDVGDHKRVLKIRDTKTNCSAEDGIGKNVNLCESSRVLELHTETKLDVLTYDNQSNVKDYKIGNILTGDKIYDCLSRTMHAQSCLDTADQNDNYFLKNLQENVLPRKDFIESSITYPIDKSHDEQSYFLHKRKTADSNSAEQIGFNSNFQFDCVEKTENVAIEIVGDNPNNAYHPEALCNSHLETNRALPITEELKNSERCDMISDINAEINEQVTELSIKNLNNSHLIEYNKADDLFSSTEGICNKDHKIQNDLTKCSKKTDIHSSFEVDTNSEFEDPKEFLNSPPNTDEYFIFSDLSKEKTDYKKKTLNSSLAEKVLDTCRKRKVVQPNLQQIEDLRQKSSEIFERYKSQAFLPMGPHIRKIPIRIQSANKEFELSISSLAQDDNIKNSKHNEKSVNLQLGLPLKSKPESKSSQNQATQSNSCSKSIPEFTFSAIEKECNDDKFTYIKVKDRPDKYSANQYQNIQAIGDIPMSHTYRKEYERYYRKQLEASLENAEVSRLQDQGRTRNANTTGRSKMSNKARSRSPHKYSPYRTSIGKIRELEMKRQQCQRKSGYESFYRRQFPNSLRDRRQGCDGNFSQKRHDERKSFLSKSPEDLKYLYDKNFKKYARYKRKSNELITYKNSTKWLKDAGVVGNSLTEEEANQEFKSYAGVKIVLTNQDYKRFLHKLTSSKSMSYSDIYCKVCGVVN